MLKWILSALVLPLAALAASPEEIERLHAALATDDLMQILSEEGIAQSEDLQNEMFPGRGGLGWARTVGAIYDSGALSEAFRAAFDAELAGADVEDALGFYDTEAGRTIARLELEARRAIVSEDVEAAAKAAYAELALSDPDRLALLGEFAEVNGLIDRNVTGALNSNLAFYQGLGSNAEVPMTEDDILRQVWGREAEIRAETEDWVFGYMTFAYETISDEDLRAYIAMSRTEAGRDLNRALFAGFDAVFLKVSRALGRATGQFSLGDEL